MRRLINVLFFVWLVCWMLPIRAQLGHQLLYSSSDNGPSHRTITAVTKDKDGLMWFGTWDGLNRFDGISFKTFDDVYDSEKNVLESRRIIQMIEGQDYMLWMLTFNNEVYSFDKRTEEYKALAPLLERKLDKNFKIEKILAVTDEFVWLSAATNGLIAVTHDGEQVIWYHQTNKSPYRINSDDIHFLQTDNDGCLWIGTEKGLNVLERKNGVYEVNTLRNRKISRSISKTAKGDWGLAFSSNNEEIALYDDKREQMEHVEVGNARINSMLFSQFGDYLYVTNENGEVYRLDLHTKQSQKLTHHSQALYTIFEDSKGNLWIELTQGGVFYLNRDFNNTVVFDPIYSERSSTVPFFCFEDNDRRVWVNFKGGGFGYYDEALQKFNFSIEEDRKLVELPQYNYRVYYDPAGIAWLFSENEGLIRLVFERKLVKHHFLENNTGKPTSEDVRSLLYDSENKLLAGTKSGKLFVKRNEQWEECRLKNKPSDDFGGFYTLLKDRDGILWIGTKSGGVLKALEDEHGDYNLQQFNTKNSPLESNQIYSLFQDIKGDLWVGTFDNGLYKKIGKDGKVTFQKIAWNCEEERTRSFHKIRHLAGDLRGNLWVATTDGLVIKSPEGNVRFVRDNPPEQVYLKNNDIQHIFSDSKGDMWLCTAGGGVTKAMGDPFGELKFENFGRDEGLFNGFVLSGGSDESGNLWFATENGLFKYNTDARKFSHVNAYTNLRGFYFSEKSIALGDGEQLFFGTTKGVAELTYKDYADVGEVPKLVFTKLSINNVEHHLIGGEKKVNINYVDRLVLDYDQNNVSIDFAITDFRSNHFNFMYRLVGVDTVWHQNGDINRATFTNLRPGNYTLEVQNDQDYYEGPSMRRLEILILPPWWKTWWAFVIYILLIGSILYVVNRLVKSMWSLKQKVIIEKKLADVKMRFFTNVSHELRTPLTLILSPTAQLIKEDKLDAHSMEYLQIIDKNAKRMQYFVDQLLELRKIQENTYSLQKSKVELVAFLKQTIANFHMLAGEKGVEIKYELQEEELEVVVDRRSMDIVVYNLLSNALKYAPRGTSVELNMEVDDARKLVSISVIDQGPGVQVDDLYKIFDLFYSDAAIEPGMDQSSGVGLALCRELVMLHGGDIGARNRLNGGFEILFTLPLDDGTAKLPVILGNTTNSHLNVVYGMNDENIALTGGLGGSKKPQVLIVEDSEDLRFFLYSTFSPSFDVLMAENGDIALEIAEIELPDIVVSDVMMPGLDGIELTKSLKQNKNTSHIPIILISAKHAIETQIKGLEYGADCYITKPFDIDYLLISVQNLMKQRERWFTKILERRDLLLRSEDTVLTDNDSLFLKNVISIVERKMTDSELKIDEIADELNMGRHTFHKKFKSLTNILPVEFVRDLRLEKAKQMIDQGAENITEVAYEVGFSNPKYFSTCFKDKFEISPKAYSQKQQRKPS